MRVLNTFIICIVCVLVRNVNVSNALAPSTFGGVVASYGQFSSQIKESAAWKRLTGLTSSSNSLARILPARAMDVVQEVVGQLRQEERIILLTGAGALRGKVQVLKGVQPVSQYSFRGIRYGKVPQRFRAAVPEKSWKGIRNALREGASCPHRNMLLDNYKGSEDCLFLNVYTPQLPNGDNGHPRLPVMFWIHGGAFSFGSGNAFLYGPDYLIPEGVVLVTINYRLGPLGFLSVESNEAPGNNGLKDQVLALKWVRDNIAAFGGDPAKVTIFGQSAGAASVHLLMMSPMAKGLFRNAIAQSGVAVNPWVIAEDARARAFSLGRVLGLETNSTEKLLAHLRRVSPQKLVDAVAKTLTPEDAGRNIAFPFIPIIENKGITSDELFLTEDPIITMRSGNYNRVPLLTGFNSREAMLFIRRARKDKNLLRSIQKDFKRFVPRDLQVNRDDDTGVTEFSQKMHQFYMGNRPVNEDTIEELIILLTDVMFVNGIERAARLHSNFANTYLYRFGYDGALGIYKRLLNVDRPGTCHGDELGYLFHFGLFNFNLDPASSELTVLHRLTRMWANFAKYSNPTHNGLNDSVLGINWEPVIPNNTTALPYMDITSLLENKVNPESVRLAFWDEMYSKYNGGVY